MVFPEVARERVRDNKIRILSICQTAFLSHREAYGDGDIDGEDDDPGCDECCGANWLVRCTQYTANTAQQRTRRTLHKQLPWQPSQKHTAVAMTTNYMYHKETTLECIHFSWYKKKWRSDLLSHSIKKDLANVSLTWFLSGPPRSESGSPDPQPPPTGQTHRQWTRLPSQESKEKLTRN